MVRFVVLNVDVLTVEINKLIKKTQLLSKIKIYHVIVKKVNVLKNIVNAMQMESNANKLVIVHHVKIADYLFLFL